MADSVEVAVKDPPSYIPQLASQRTASRGSETCSRAYISGPSPPTGLEMGVEERVACNKQQTKHLPTEAGKVDRCKEGVLPGVLCF